MATACLRRPSTEMIVQDGVRREPDFYPVRSRCSGVAGTASPRQISLHAQRLSDRKMGRFKVKAGRSATARRYLRGTRIVLDVAACLPGSTGYVTIKCERPCISRARDAEAAAAGASENRRLCRLSSACGLVRAGRLRLAIQRRCSGRNRRRACIFETGGVFSWDRALPHRLPADAAKPLRPRTTPAMTRQPPRRADEQGQHLVPPSG